MEDLNSYEYRCFWESITVIEPMDISNLNDNFGA